jgi:hypothetical protein
VEEKVNLFLRFRSILFSLYLLIIFGSCTTSSPTISQPSIGPTITADPSASPSPTPFGPLQDLPTIPAPTLLSPIATIATDLVVTPVPWTLSVPSQYSLSILLDLFNHTVSVDETIYYLNSTGETLNGIVLAVEPNLWKNCFIPGQIIIDGLEVDKTSLDGDRLVITLNKPLMAGEAMSLFQHFYLRLPLADQYHIFGYNNYQTNLVDWYPFIVPYVPGQGWLLHPTAPVGEHLVYDPQIIDVSLRLTDTKRSVTIAASALAEVVSDGLHYHLDKARSFAISASEDYQAKSIVENGVVVNSYFYESESPQGTTVMVEVAKALKTYEILFGPSHHSSLSVVESPYFDGMEYDGLIFLSRDYYVADNGTVLNNLIDIAVHETAHQWWYGSVANDQAMEPWLDEALATYSERLFYEWNYPNVTAWQSFRIDSYNPAGWVDTDIYHGKDFRTYTNGVYLRGAQFLQTLREQIGEQAFFSFLKDYAQQMAGKRATAQDFFRILRSHTNADVSNVISEYFQKVY